MVQATQFQRQKSVYFAFQFIAKWGMCLNKPRLEEKKKYDSFPTSINLIQDELKKIKFALGCGLISMKRIKDAWMFGKNALKTSTCFNPLHPFLA